MRRHFVLQQGELEKLCEYPVRAALGIHFAIAPMARRLVTMPSTTVVTMYGNMGDLNLQPYMDPPIPLLSVRCGIAPQHSTIVALTHPLSAPNHGFEAF